ncbi:MAG: DNA-3-methyladenine glycosylase I, partial [Chloroflexota bacterium]|nr:DNA-3-methyladenine glycosylase I [Chloroflexota bacterium]
LKARGMRFVGPTIAESFMEATGMLDHHSKGCYRRGRAPRT